MRHNRLRNYIAPGLTSYLIGGEKFGKVRLFEAERETLEFITPHSHRFDFTCLVLAGCAHNTLFYRADSGAEEWCHSTINQVCGKDGILKFTHERENHPSYWYHITKSYAQRDTYSMTHNEIHSIKFSRGAKVLFFEGPELQSTSHMLEPWEHGHSIHTFRTEPWMFERE